MAKQNITLKNSFELLDAFEATQFVDKAAHSQRLAALPFFRSITLYAFDSAAHALPGDADVASAQQALLDHQAAIAAGCVKTGASSSSQNDWLEVLPEEGEVIAEKLRRDDPEITDGIDTVAVTEGKPASSPELTQAACIPDAPGPAADVVTPLTSDSPEPIEVQNTAVLAFPTIAHHSADHVAEPAALTDAAVANWEQPVDLAEAYGPDFPVHALSAWHQRFVTELAEQVQIPVDVPALASLAMIGAAAAKTVSVEIQPGDEQPTNFWALIISPPGDGKTPLLGELRRPFDQVQATMRDVERADAARAHTEHRISTITLQRLEREAAACDDAEERDELTARAVELRKRLEQRRAGVPTLSTGDCTQLGLISLMDRNKGRLLLLTDEGDQLFSRVQQRSKRGAEDIDDMLKAYSGATIDRHDVQRELRVPAAALSIVATTQPRPFSKVMGIEAYHSKGFIGRFALALPRSIQGARKQRRASVSEESRANYQNLLRRLLEQPIPDVPVALPLSEEAFHAFAECGADADRAITTNRDASFGAWIGKLRGLTARIAGILHISDPDNLGVNVISGETMARAIEVSRYLAAHARVAYEHSERAALDEDPRRLLHWIRDTRREQFTHAEAVSSFSGRLNAREVEACIERLVVARYLRERSSGKSRGGRPRKPSYLVSPWVYRNR